MYNSILVPTDGSQDMTPVVEQALELASLCDSEVHVMHVVDERAYMSVPEDARATVRDTLQADGEAFTKAVAEQALEKELEVIREVRWGDPAPSIVSYAVENEIDAIVMGTHGRTGYERYMLGSVAERVVRTAPIPTLTVAVGDTEQQKAEILGTTDGDVRQPDEDEESVSPSDQADTPQE